MNTDNMNHEMKMEGGSEMQGGNHGSEMQDGNHEMQMMMMQMTFYISTRVTCLFDFWDVKTTTGMAGTCACWFVLAIFYQGLKFTRGYVQKSCECSEPSSLIAKVLASRSPSPQYNTLPEGGNTHSVGAGGLVVRTVNWKLHLTQTALQMVQTAMSYFLMLVVMTYNLWLCLAVLFGDAMGYLIFHRYTFDNSDHCN